MSGHLRLVAALSLVLVSGTAGLSPAQDQGKFYAVIVGVSKFSNLPNDDWLEFADADAQAFAKFVASPRGRQFQTIDLLLNEQASITAIKKKLATNLPKQIKPEDTVYIFLATHGMIEKEAAKEGYLLAYDTDREDPFTTALRMKDLADIVQNRLQKANRIFLFADACRAGKLNQSQGNIAAALAEVGKRGGLLASRSNEFSREGKQWGGGHGVFTYYLLKGLMGEADKDKDKTITTGELLDYVTERVAADTGGQQHVREIGELDRDAPMAYPDKAGPSDLNLSEWRPFPAMQHSLLALRFRLAGMLQPPGTEIASLAFALPESEEVRAEFQRALRERRLLPPESKNAWDLFQQYRRLPVDQSQKEALQDDLFIALADAGERILSDYRRGDQFVRLDAARYQQGAQLFSYARQLDPSEPAIEAKAKFMAARVMIERRQYPEAVSLLKEAIALDTKAAYSYNALGIAYMLQGQLNAAIENFRAASERADKWVYPHANLAWVYVALERLGDAEQEYRKGLQLGTELGRRYSYLHYNLGQLYLQEKKSTAAEEQFRRAVEMNPDDAKSYYHLALFAMSQGKSGDAEFNLRKAVELDARFPEALDALGRLLLKSKKLDEAEQVFIQMVGLDPSSPQPLSGLGDVHAAQGNFQQAADDYRQALARASDPKLQRDLQKKLKSVEKRK